MRINLDKKFISGLLLGLALFGTQLGLIPSRALAQTRIAANNSIKRASSVEFKTVKRVQFALSEPTEVFVRYDLGQSTGCCTEHRVDLQILVNGTVFQRDSIPFFNYDRRPFSPYFPFETEDFDAFFPSQIIMGLDRLVFKADIFFPEIDGPLLTNYKRVDRQGLGNLGRLTPGVHTFELQLADAGWNALFEIYSEQPQRPIAPDATGFGPLKITSVEYKFPAKQQYDVLAKVSSNPKAKEFFFTELWARVYMPADLDQPPYPLLGFLHGNHFSCKRIAGIGGQGNNNYATTGNCDSKVAGSEFTVLPNHEGYGYLAERLASWGYIVVSINATRGIGALDNETDGQEFIPARARLVLKHLQKLSEWNSFGSQSELDVDGRFPGPELRGLLDFTEVGLLGHSVGGEGVRAAYNFYQFGGDLPNAWSTKIRNKITFRGIFEIAPEDGAAQGQSRLFDPHGIEWNVLLPMCDGDNINLPGVKPFDRMIAVDDQTQKSKYLDTIFRIKFVWYLVRSALLLNTFTPNAL